MQANDRYLISCIFKSNNLSNKTWTPESNCLLNAALGCTSGCSGGYKGMVNRVTTLPLGPRGTIMSSGAPPACQTWDLGAPSCRQGHHRPVRGTTGLSRQHRHIKDTTELSGVSPTYQGHYWPTRDTTDLSVEPPIYQGHHWSVWDTTGLSETPSTYLGRRRPTRGGTTDLSEAPPTYQRHRWPIGGTADLSETSSVYQGSTDLFWWWWWYVCVCGGGGKVGILAVSWSF